MNENIIYLNKECEDDEEVSYRVKIESCFDDEGFFTICYDEIEISYICPETGKVKYLPLSQYNANYLKNNGISISMVDGKYYVGEHYMSKLKIRER